MLGVYRAPFSFEPEVRNFPDGLTLFEMAEGMGMLAQPGFPEHGVICINGHPVERQHWRHIKPRPIAVTEVTFHAPIRGGGGGDGGGKNPLALVASLALVAATGFVAGGGLAATLGGAFKAGALGANLAAAGVSLTGSLLLNALSPPPVRLSQVADSRSADRSALGLAGADGNPLDPNAPIPRVVGTRKIFPPLVAEPLVTFDGDDEIVEAAYCLAGPHALGEIKIAGAPIGTIDGVEFEIREGWQSDSRIGLVSRQSRTEEQNIELRGHVVSDADGVTLQSTSGDTDDALPLPQTVSTRTEPDELQLQIAFNQGLHRNASETDRLRVPFRLRYRPAGQATWIVGPELHFRAATLRAMRATIRFIWDESPSSAPTASSEAGWVEARILSPAQTIAPEGAARMADAYFGDPDAGDGYMTAANFGTTAVDHVELDRYEARIYLDTAVFPKGRYEFEIVRGYAFREANYAVAAYTLGGSTRDPFYYQGGTPAIYQSRDGIVDTVGLVRVVNLWNEHPVPNSGLALVAIKARNRRVERISAIASGYVKDWDGSAWSNWTTTSNPAPHYRDVIAGDLNADPVPSEIVDDKGMVEWRQACIDNDYKCDVILDGGSVEQATRLISSAGFGQPYMSDVWGVVRDYDRSEDGVVQTFIPRNSFGFSWGKAFSGKPEAFRITFPDKDRDYEARQITYPDRPSAARVEQVAYEALVTEEDVIRRAKFDYTQADLRSTNYSLTAPAEHIVCRKGDLVGVQHDMLSSQAGWGRIADIRYDGEDVSAIVLDNEVPVQREPGVKEVVDFHDVDDVRALGQTTAIAIRRAGAPITVHELTNQTGEAATLTFEEPIVADGLELGCLVSVGPLGRPFQRLIVTNIDPREDLTAVLTMVDEAPQLWN